MLDTLIASLKEFLKKLIKKKSADDKKKYPIMLHSVKISYYTGARQSVDRSISNDERADSQSTATSHLLITFANSLYPDQAQYNVGPDLDLNCLTS